MDWWLKLYKIIILSQDMIKDILALSLTMEIYFVIHLSLQIMLLIEILFTFKCRVTTELHIWTKGIRTLNVIP